MHGIFTLNGLPFSPVVIQDPRIMASAAVLVPQPRRSPSPSMPSRSESHRQSLLSTNSILSSPTASYRTAPLSAASDASFALSTASSHSSSGQTISPTVREPENLNPIYTLSSTQEIHIVKVTNDTVQIEPGPVPDSYLERVGKTVINTIQPNGNCHAGPPPPSPPASIEQEVEENVPQPPSSFKHPELAVAHPKSASMPEARHDRQSSTSSSKFSTLRVTHSPETVRRSSTDTKASHTTLRPPLVQATQSVPEASSSTSKAASHLSVDGYLQPPPLSTPQRPARRNTTGSSLWMMPCWEKAA
ncbi:hypothetical protein NLJ89_g6783 [Agrocybe chaxingu]|uniref:Uncharacterized protein n=1 Tax=Agrocybe chaxingu TaxID=84603 RepID=A0A9W8K5R6_9AGAR|nr:hypothetical protein NLJ89_g6783 [Agrocybe chaxingu]